MPDFVSARARMVDVQLRRRGIHDENVLSAMQTVPREAFVPPERAAAAYQDSPLPIGEGQTISQPYIVALMLQEAAIRPDDTVLDIGTGSGYAAAVMSRMARQVFTIERHAALAEAAERRFRALRYENIVTRTGDGTRGWPEAGPFAAILVAAAAQAVPAALAGQLAVGGRLIIPLEEAGGQRLLRITRTGEARFEQEDLAGVIFVPLVAEPEGPATQR